jgi:hypothetical protein
MEQQIVELRHQHMRWGPRKLKVVLERQHPDVTWPAASTRTAAPRRTSNCAPEAAADRSVYHSIRLGQ